MNGDLAHGSVGVSIAVGSVRHMRLKASLEAERLIEERGGVLYVWAKHSRCCGGGVTMLETASDPPDRPFRRVSADRVEVFLDERLTPPAELELEVRGIRRKRLCAYWNGCAYVV
jgi:hypothetical protein